MARYTEMVTPSERLVNWLKDRDLNKLARVAGAPNIKTLIKAKSGEKIAAEKLVQIVNLPDCPLTASPAVELADKNVLSPLCDWLDYSARPMFSDFPDYGDWSVLTENEIDGELVSDHGVPIKVVGAVAGAFPLDGKSLLNLLGQGFWSAQKARPYEPLPIFRFHPSFKASPASNDSLKQVDAAIKNSQNSSASNISASSLLELVEAVQEPSTALEASLEELGRQDLHLLGTTVSTSVFFESADRAPNLTPEPAGLSCPLILVASQQVQRIEVLYSTLLGFRFPGQMHQYYSEEGFVLVPGEDWSPPDKNESLGNIRSLYDQIQRTD